MRNILLFLYIVLFINNLWGQNPDKAAKYWIIFKDKSADNQAIRQVSPQTLQNREQLALPLFQDTDLPLSENYLRQIKALNINVLQKSKWLNAISAYLTDVQISKLKALNFVEDLVLISANDSKSGYYTPSGQTQITQPLSTNFNAFDQLQGDYFQKAGLSGKDVKIGIVDVGFAEADKSDKLRHIFENQQVIASQDFIQPKNKKIFKSFTAQDWHGREVWQMIGGIEPKSKQAIGFAPKAKYFLARTDHGTLETRSEEDNWIAAIEWLDSLGVRLVNTSLGYAHHFTNPNENYFPSQMNGKTTLISKFARIAAQEKGMILVASAGNEGDNPSWLVVTAPADSPDVIAVGTSHAKYRAKMYYSSIGPDSLSYIKPDVSCYADMGTSFAAPMITGMIACLLEKKPDLSPSEVRLILSKSAHLAENPNNFLGYGIPQAKNVLQLLDNLPTNSPRLEIVKVKGDKYSLSDVPKDNLWIIAFHKKGEFTVLYEQKIRSSAELQILKMQEATHTTVDLGEKVIEIIWEK
jgi:subtilisin family serine protease